VRLQNRQHFLLPPSSLCENAPTHRGGSAVPLAFRRGLKVAYLLVAAVILALAVSRLASLSLTTDELLEYQGVVDHVRFARQVLQGGKPDFHEEIVYNLENYGIIAKLPAYLISWLAGVADPANYEALAADATPYQLYFQISHLTSLLLGLGSSALLILVARAMHLRLAWSAGLILLLTPRFIGDGLFNIKDIPFAFFYLLYSTSLFLRLRRSPDRGSSVPAPAATATPTATPARLILLSALAAGLMGSMKIVALVPVLLTEALVAVLLPKRCRWLDGVHIGIDALLLSLLFTPSSWLEPLRFLNGAVKLFRSHDWPGGTWWNGEFLSRVQDPLHWSTAGYLLRWIPSVTPLWILLLALVGVGSLLTGWPRSALSQPETLARSDAQLDRQVLPFALRRQRLLLFLPFLLQLLLLPGLAVVGNANLYDGVRHVLFLYPPLALLAAFGLDRLCAFAGSHGVERALRPGLLVLALLAVLTLVDSLTLFPYSYVYVNEPMRFVLSPANTAYDYWVYSGSDAARGALRAVSTAGAASGSGAASASPACLARVDLPDPVRAMVEPDLRPLACDSASASAEVLPAQPMALRLASAARADQPGCHAVSRWQWPWFRRTLSIACLEPLPAAPPPR